MQTIRKRGKPAPINGSGVTLFGHSRTCQEFLVIGTFAVVLTSTSADAQTAIQPTSSSPTNTASISVDMPVRALVNAMQAQDASAIRAQFAPTATQAYGADGQMKDPADTAKWLESDIIDQRGKVDDPEFTVNGNEVVVRGQYNALGYTSKANFLFTVENGLITSWRMRY